MSFIPVASRVATVARTSTLEPWNAGSPYRKATPFVISPELAARHALTDERNRLQQAFLDAPDEAACEAIMREAVALDAANAPPAAPAPYSAGLPADIAQFFYADVPAILAVSDRSQAHAEVVVE